MRRYGSNNNYQHQQQGTKVPVVYYLCKNNHLEHPHFIEVPLSSNEGLYLRDVLYRLNVLRGKKMAAMYSWSCKRSYQNGFVWQDLAENDLILPAQGNEYILKGSELLVQSPLDRHSHGLCNAKIQHFKQQDSPVSTKPDEASSSSSPTAAFIKEAAKFSSQLRITTPPQEPIRASYTLTTREQSSPSTQPSGSSGEFSVESIGKIAPSIAVDSRIAATGHGNCRPASAQDASTQTEGGVSRVDVVDTCIIGVSTGEGFSHVKFRESQSKCIPPRPTPSTAFSSCGRTGTLESLIRDEIRKRNSLRIAEEEVFVPTRAKTKAIDMLMQLISCGSISVKDHYSFGSVRTHRPRLSNNNFCSPLVPNSVVLSELGCLSESQRVSGLKEQENGYFTGSKAGANKHNEMVDGVCTLKRSSPFDEVRSSDIPNFKIDKAPPMHGIRMFSTGPVSCGSSILSSSKLGNKRVADSSSVKDSSKMLESFQEEKEKVTKIEERLNSGARVVIQSRSPCKNEVHSLE